MTKFLRALQDAVIYETPKTNPDTGARIEFSRVTMPTTFTDKMRVVIVFEHEFCPQEPNKTIVDFKQDLWAKIMEELGEDT